MCLLNPTSMLPRNACVRRILCVSQPPTFKNNWYKNFANYTSQCAQVCTFHDGCKQGIDQQIFNRKSISRTIMHPQS